jgi:hypothetical protein
MDACTYLQSYDRWEEAAWLAKMTLPKEECAAVLKRWSSYLINTHQKVRKPVCFLELFIFDFEAFGLFLIVVFRKKQFKFY